MSPRFVISPEPGCSAGGVRAATSAFQVRVFRTPAGYLAWVDGLGTVQGRTLTETRREARRFVEAVVGGAFPDRPTVDAAGAREVLEFAVSIRLRRAENPARRAPSKGPLALRRGP